MLRLGWTIPAQILLGVALSALGFLPLFGGPTYEFALVSGLIAPGFVAALSAMVSARSPGSAEPAMQHALALGTRWVALLGLIALLHGLRAGFCDFWGQWTLFALGPLCGVWCGAAWGCLAGLASRKVRGGSGLVLALCLALAGPACGVLLSLWRYWASPMIFAFDPFVGYFSGTLYDTVIDGTGRLLSYRAGTLGAVLAAYMCTRVLDLRPQLDPGRLRDHAGSLLLLLVGAAVACGVLVNGPALGHFHTDASIREGLGHALESKHCQVVYASGILARDAQALARECDGHIAEQSRYFQIAPPERVRVYLFASATQKARYMGAANTYIAKPWRREVYIQARGYPHPVLGHELAHVMAGEFGQGPFRIAGPFGGLVPDPGRIEGVAVAAAPRMDDPLTLGEWAAAMRKLELLPPLGRVFRLSFLGESSSKAYTVAGAFVAWLHEQYGVQAVKSWYGGRSLEQVLGKSLAELEKQFVGMLDRLEVSDAAMEVARARFDRQGLFARRCPHQVDEALGNAGRALDGHDPGRARELYARVLELDPHNVSAELGLAQCTYREGQFEQAATEYAKLAEGDEWHQRQRTAALRAQADALLALGKLEQAAALYPKLRENTVSENELRALDVRELAQGSEPAAVALRALFVGDPLIGKSWLETGAALGRWSAAEPTFGVADYLLGKNLWHQGHWEAAANLLDSALRRDLGPERVRREALRTRLFAACALRQKRRAAEVLEEILKDHPRGTTTGPLLQFAERCGAKSPAAASHAHPQ